MDDYICIKFFDLTLQKKEILLAELNEIGFDGFEENDAYLAGFIASRNFKENLFSKIMEREKCNIIKEIIAPKNWNEDWEKNFEPVIINNCAIRAYFHPPITTVDQEIIITPKMSFGTGHHATTYMMVALMQNMNIQNKTVLDFGTGTGILAIFAEKKNAARIIGLDADDCSLVNAHENIHKNNCSRITIIKSDSVPLDTTFDVILANINKDVITRNFPAMQRQLAKNGYLVISGLLSSDKTAMKNLANNYHMEIITEMEKDSWAAYILSHS